MSHIVCPLVSSHMPYLCIAEDQVLILHSQAIPQLFRRGGKLQSRGLSPWKLHFSFPNVPGYGPINTGLPEYAEECSPCLSLSNGSLILSFIARLPQPGCTISSAQVPGGFHLFTMIGSRIDELKDLKCERVDCASGFVSHRYRVYVKDNSILVDESFGKKRSFLTDFASIHRISPCFDSDNVLLITGQRKDQSIGTVIFDLLTNEVSGQVLHKAALTNKPSILINRKLAAIPDLHNKLPFRTIALGDYEICEDETNIQEQ